MRLPNQRIVLPVSIILFFSVTKWWFVLPVDAPDTMMWGFPLPCYSEGWYTSGSLQFFIGEGILDLFIYYLISLILILIVSKLFPYWHPKKWLTVLLQVIAGVYLAMAAYVMCLHENLFYINRTFDTEVIQSGYKFIWQFIPRPSLKL